MKFVLKHFNDLSSAETYAMLQLRQAVFVIEQNCIYPDCDEKDVHCWHLLGYIGNNLISCARLVPPGISYNEPSIGRVCTAKTVRLEGAGLALMQSVMKAMNTLWPGFAICISAQSYLEKFYMKFGFVTVSEPYLEDDIPHIKMICEKH